jgi:hypothetical protein
VSGSHAATQRAHPHIPNFDILKLLTILPSFMTSDLNIKSQKKFVNIFALGNYRYSLFYFKLTIKQVGLLSLSMDSVYSQFIEIFYRSEKIEK